jgi:hypothetical protein
MMMMMMMMVVVVVMVVMMIISQEVGGARVTECTDYNSRHCVGFLVNEVARNNCFFEKFRVPLPLSFHRLSKYIKLSYFPPMIHDISNWERR